MPMCPSPPAPMTTTRVPGPSTGMAFLTAWMAVRPASASAAMLAGSSEGSSLTTERALVCRYSAKPPSMPEAGEGAVLAVHVVAGPAGAAQPAGDQRVHDHGVADLDVGHAGADLVHPARVLVPRDVGQRRVLDLRPLPLLDVEVGAAQARRADADDDVQRARDLRLVDLVDLERLVVGVQACRDHGTSSSSAWFDTPYRTRSRSRQMPPLASRLRLTRPARRSHVRRSPEDSGRPVAGHERRVVRLVRQAERGAQRARRAPRPPCPGGPRPAARRPPRGSPRRPAAPRTPAPGARAAPCAGTARAARRGSPAGLARERPVEAVAAPDGLVDLRSRVVVHRARPSPRAPRAAGARRSTRRRP